MRVELPSDLFTSCLSPTDSSTPVRFQYALEKATREGFVLGCAELDLRGYEKLGRCRRALVRSAPPVQFSKWGGPDRDRVETKTPNGAWSVNWSGGDVIVVHAEWNAGNYQSVAHDWVIAESDEAAKAFLLDVERSTNEPGESILVFHGGCWTKNRELHEVTQRSSFDDLILAPGLKEQIRVDFRRFLAARSAYERVGLSWRRGALFLGPPGNGKTHCLRALVKELGVPALYVQSVKHRYETEESNLKKVFERARQLRPCVLVLEDLDALINADNRSFFLNQLDGFEKNVGLIVLATTNHPERIDPAILDRPSRFDRKYHFELPAADERRRYLALWQTKLAAETGWDDHLSDELATKTAGFSFAYLKELVTSVLQRLVAETGASFASLAHEEVDALQAQRQTRTPKKVAEDAEDVAVGGAEQMLDRAMRRLFSGG